MAAESVRPPTLPAYLLCHDRNRTREHMLDVGADDRWSDNDAYNLAVEMEGRANPMKCNDAYLKACLERKVPISVLEENANALEGKTEREQDEMRERWALEILRKYPKR